MHREVFDPARRHLIQAAAAAGASLALPAAAQTGFPRGVIKIIVGLPPGGTGDVQARALAPILEASLKQPVIVENKPGGQFQVSVQALLSAPADGHTILFLYNSYPVAQATHKLFDLERDTIPVSQLTTTPVLLMVRADSPHKTLSDLFAQGRREPGRLTYSTYGPDSVEAMLIASIAKAAGVTGNPIPYRGGPDAFKALLGGEIEFGLFTGFFGKNFIPPGKARALAVLGSERWSEFPEVPTIAEAGVRISPFSYWTGLVVRKGTPAAAVDRLFKEVRAALNQPEVVKKYEASASYAAPSGMPEEFGRLIRSELALAKAGG